MPIEKFTPTFTLYPKTACRRCRPWSRKFCRWSGELGDVARGAGPAFEDEGPGTEHFSLFWPGKRQARRLAAQPSKKTLRPVPAQGVHEDSAHNLFIEGDNLEVLKLLQKSYAGRVKLIYIDSPYNTGNDFVYQDDFLEPLDDYPQRTGQANAEGVLTSNARDQKAKRNDAIFVKPPEFRAFWDKRSRSLPLLG